MIMKVLARCGVLLWMLLLSSSSLVYAVDKPIELTADTIEYNSMTDMATAQGNVTVIADGGKLTGNNAQYDFATKKITINGNVQVHKGDLSLLAGYLEATNNNIYTAREHVQMVKGPNTLVGPEIIYNQQANTLLMPNGGSANGPEAQLSGNYLEGNLATNSYEARGNVFLFNKANDIKSYSNSANYIGTGSSFVFSATGNVRMSSPSRDMTASANNAKYTSADNGKLILQGEAQARQHNSIVRGNVLTIYLGDNVHIK